MNRKHLLVMSIGVLLCLGLGVAVAGPVGHWRFDEGSGTVVHDSSANGLDGNLMGDVTWVAGKMGAGALSFDGSECYVTVPDAPVLDLGERLTIALWVNAEDLFTFYFLVCKQSSGSARNYFPGNYEFRLESGTGALQLGHQTSEQEDYVFYTSSSPITAKQWSHIAVTLEKGGLVQFYIDGGLAGTANQTAEFGILNDEPVLIGTRADRYSDFNGELDDVRIYDRVLTAEQIGQLVDGVEPVFPKAEMPEPADGTVVDEAQVTLAWQAGDLAVSQNVYFGTEAEAVANATPDDADLLLGSTTDASITVGGGSNPLVPGTVYYWRVDGVDDSNPDSPWVGDVWSFRIRPYIAWDPSPADGVSYVSTNQQLTWETGIAALFHYVYFGEDFDEVNNATFLEAESTNQPVFAPELEPDKTYYWRIDEFAIPAPQRGDVWSFTTVPVIEVDDESLQGWWTFDQEGAGSAVDWSGHGLHGMISGDPQWVDGAADAAVWLDGVDDYFTTPVPTDLTTDTATMTAWIKPEKIHGYAGIVFHRASAASATCGLNLVANNQLGYHWAVGESWGFTSGLIVPMNEWSFVALVVEPEQATLYLDGGDVWVTNEIEHPAVTFNTGLSLGADPVLPDRCFGGALDDLRFYTKAMTPAEIGEVMAMGTKPPVVEDPLVIESFDGYKAYSIVAGQNVWDVWSEGYTGNGTGSTLGHATVPFMERVVTMGGGQSLPMYYDNTGQFRDIDGALVSAKHSEISRQFSPAQNLTRNGATTLVLWMRGDPTNTAEAADVFYVTLGDGNKTATVTLAQPGDLRSARWRKLEIALDSVDVNVAAITTITIGVGDQNSAVAGGMGFVYIDNIGLEVQ